MLRSCLDRNVRLKITKQKPIYFPRRLGYSRGARSQRIRGDATRVHEDENERRESHDICPKARKRPAEDSTTSDYLLLRNGENREPWHDLRRNGPVAGALESREAG